MRLVKKAEYICDYKLKITFDNNVIEVCDILKINGLTGVFKQLKDIEKFKAFYIEDGILKWSEQLDSCPDRLYKEGEKYAS